MGHRKTARSELHACAVEQHGYVTDRDTLRLGIADDVLLDLVSRGELELISSGLFRLTGAPRTRRHRFAEAVLRVGQDGYLSHDAVLALHDLTDHEPLQVRVSTPRPPSGRVPHHIEVLHHRVPVEDLTTYQGIRSTTVTRALLDCRPLLAAELLVAAAERAVERGLLLRRERHAVLDALESSAS
jgi:predicted transcriptional regulator of viral defense system